MTVWEATDSWVCSSSEQLWVSRNGTFDPVVHRCVRSCMDLVIEQSKTPTEWTPEIVVKHYRGGHLIEQRHCEDPQAVGDVVESWEADPTPDGELIVVEPHPPEAIIALLRAIADALEQQRPLAMAQPFPRLRLQLVTEEPELRGSRRGELKLLWQEQSHPGG